VGACYRFLEGQIVNVPLSVEIANIWPIGGPLGQNASRKPPAALVTTLQRIAAANSRRSGIGQKRKFLPEETAGRRVVNIVRFFTPTGLALPNALFFLNLMFGMNAA